MDKLEFLQHYWWLLISLLGAALVFLLFVQGGQAMIRCLARSDAERAALIDVLGRKWELTFTTLVTFGGAFFASFPLFYSTSFGGAFYVWTALLLCFVVQAVAYEYRSKPGNLYGARTYDLFLTLNGLLGPLLLGTALSTLFTGAPFTVDRLRLAAGAAGAADGSVVISQWATPWHGLEAAASWHNLTLGLAVLCLAVVLGCQFFLNTLADETLLRRARRAMTAAAAAFLLLFLAWFVRLLTIDGFGTDPTTGLIVPMPRKYLLNLLEMPAVAAALAVGVGLLLAGMIAGARGSRRALWWGGAGTVLAVAALLLCAGWNGTAYYPSTVDMQSSLTIRNSSSSLFTLRTMAWVSLLLPPVAAYIAVAWRAVGRPDATGTAEAGAGAAGTPYADPDARAAKSSDGPDAPAR